MNVASSVATITTGDKYPHLANAPIVEAVVDWRAKLPIDFDIEKFKGVAALRDDAFALIRAEPSYLLWWGVEKVTCRCGGIVSKPSIEGVWSVEVTQRPRNELFWPCVEVPDERSVTRVEEWNTEFISLADCIENTTRVSLCLLEYVLRINRDFLCLNDSETAIPNK